MGGRPPTSVLASHTTLHPLAPRTSAPLNAAAFPFFYIEPSKKEYRPIVSKFVGPVSVTDAEKIAPIGGWVGRLGGWAVLCLLL